jgi:hypothetical protein
LSTKGVTVEQAAHNIWENNFSGEGLFAPMSVEEIRDVIIEILQTGKNNYIDEISGQREINELKIQLSNLKVSAPTNYNELNEFTEQEKESKLINFAEKYNMSKEQALEYINEALVKDRESVINKLKDCF